MSPVHDDDETGTADLPDLSEQDEAFVRGLLATLPAVPVPAELAGRLDAALRAEAGEAAPATAQTVVPLEAARRSRGRRSTRILQVAAGGLVLVAGVLGVLKLTGSSQSADSAASAGAGAAAPAEVVTHSGHAYGDDTLVADVRSLATSHAPATLAARSPVVPAASGGTPTSLPSPDKATEGAFSASTVPAPSTRALAAQLFTSQATLVPCLAAVEDGLPAPVTPLAMDAGTYRGEVALVVVLPGSVDPKRTYDVFVVGADCGQEADAHLLKYLLVQVR